MQGTVIQELSDRLAPEVDRGMSLVMCTAQPQARPKSRPDHSFDLAILES
jgi:hypothetical protein